MAHYMPPALLALFAPRPCPKFKPSASRKTPLKLNGISQYLDQFEDGIPPPPSGNIIETPQQRKERVRKEKDEAHKKVLEERTKNWNPKNNLNATKHAYKTLFVARLSYDVTESDLKKEFDRYGPIREIKLIRDRQGKPRGYAFIEFENSRDLKDAFERADGKVIHNRRILVDVERGRTVPTWKPRKLGGGLGNTRAPPIKKEEKNDEPKSNHQSSTSSHYHQSSSRHHNSGSKDNHSNSHRNDSNNDRYKGRRDRYRDRDFRDRDRRNYREGHNNNNNTENNPENTKRQRSRSRERDRNGRDKHNKRNNYDNNNNNNNNNNNSNNNNNNKYEKEQRNRDKQYDSERGGHKERIDRDRHRR